MKAQKASNRIQHPYARYSNAGALSCSLCSLPLKSEVLWPSHLTSKTHRSNLKKQKEQEEQQLSAAQAHAEASSSSNSGLKRPAEADEDESGKRARLDGENDVDGDDAPSGPASFLPAGFFSNPEAANGPQGEDAEAGLSAAGDEPIDEEWAAFEATLNKAEDPVASTSTATGYTTAATITAQPVLFEEEQDNEEGKADGEAGDGEEEDDEEPKETEEERREREEREELMERIETWVSCIVAERDA